jgi:hypothetical protein
MKKTEQARERVATLIEVREIVANATPSNPALLTIDALVGKASKRFRKMLRRRQLNLSMINRA